MTGRHHRKLPSAARSDPGPDTELLPALPAVMAFRPLPGWGQLVKCRCGRICAGRYCCWVCEIAADGGWTLAPHDGRPAWWDIHTFACERLHAARNPEAARQDAAWHAGSAPPPRETHG